MSCSTNQNGEETLFHINQNGDNQCFHAVPNSGETPFHEEVTGLSGVCLEDTGGGENQDGVRVLETAAAAPPSPSKGTYTDGAVQLVWNVAAVSALQHTYMCCTC
jgi:hypothetical protein